MQSFKYSFSLIHEHILTCLYVNILSCVKWSSSNAKSKAAPGKLSKAISKISAIPGPNLNLLSIQWQRATGVFLKQHARGNLRRHGDFFNMKTGSRLGRKHPESWQHRGGKMVLKTDLARKSSSASATWLKLCFWYQVLLIVGGSCWKLQKWGIETAEQCFAFTVLAKISWGCWKGGGSKISGRCGLPFWLAISCPVRLDCGKGCVVGPFRECILNTV